MPKRSYLLCTTPRSGSTLLCAALTATGVAGRPAEYFEALRHSNLPRQPREYFEGLDDPLLHALLPDGPQDIAAPLGSANHFGDYIAWVLGEGTTANGVFGAKLMWGHLPDLVARVRDTGPPRDDAEIVDALFPRSQFVRVFRRDKVMQAISLWKALQTQVWRFNDGAKPAEARSAVYHYAAIDHLTAQLRDQESSWDGFFARAGREPMVVTFEELAADVPAAVARTLAFIGVRPPSGSALRAPRMRRQADEASAQWAERYRMERAAVDAAH